MNLIFDCIKTLLMALAGGLAFLVIVAITAVVGAVIVRLLALRRMKREFPL